MSAHEQADAYPCRIIEADFETGIVTLQMKGKYTVSAGPKFLCDSGAIEQAVLQSPEVHAPMQQWQPIETAPKDGTAILVCNERGAWVAQYDPVYQSGYRPENPWFSLMLNHDHMRKGKPYAPTHWMPLPPPPTE